MRILLLIVLTCLPGWCLGQYTVSASVDRTTMSDDDRMTYTLQIAGATSPSEIATPRAPAAVGMSLVSPYALSERRTLTVQGKLRQALQFRWIFRPTRHGMARIEPVVFSIRGQSYRTQAFEVWVAPDARPAPASSPPDAVVNGQAQDAPTRAARITNRDLFIRAVPSARTAYQNDQVLIEYRVYYRDGVSLRGNTRLAGSWEAEGLWREELDIELRPQPEPVIQGGVRFNTFLLKRVAVFPTRTGRLLIDPLKVETEASVALRSIDPLERMFEVAPFETVQIASTPVVVQVHPLPAGAPDNFSGAVGKYVLQTQVDRESVQNGESIRLTATVAGAGNLAMLQIPAFRAPDTFEQYDPEVQTHIDRAGLIIQGSRSYTWVLIPRQNGRHTLPPVSFSWFDPSQGKYVQAASQPLEIDVAGVETPGRDDPDVALTTDAPTDAGNVFSKWIDSLDNESVRTIAYGALGTSLLFLALAGLAGVRKRRRAAAASRPEPTTPPDGARLRKAAAFARAGDVAAFHREIDLALRQAVTFRTDTSATGLTQREMDILLQQSGVGLNTRRELLSLLSMCDLARFSPIQPDTDDMNRTLKTADAVFQMLLSGARSKPS